MYNTYVRMYACIIHTHTHTHTHARTHTHREGRGRDLSRASSASIKTCLCSKRDLFIRQKRPITSILGEHEGERAAGRNDIQGRVQHYAQHPCSQTPIPPYPHTHIHTIITNTIIHPVYNHTPARERTNALAHSGSSRTCMHRHVHTYWRTACK